MGAKGSVNVANISALYMELTKVTGDIQDVGKEIISIKKSISDNINGCEVDEQTKEHIAETQDVLGGIITILFNQLAEINKAINKLIDSAMAIDRRSGSKLNTNREDIGKGADKLGRR